ncbi:hypothetical protein GSI_04006 [Ganoderma sinense ZZ0214-1]|uniref:Nucleotidyl transferase AbiEii/AbiGii toxin family protein n=1 Tax=Ganoderma sinense ZZ0214-1 TaxID=1077348 RepID=A0A2G8SHY8_9APHY|nr:hypothetical protein GSI_04006 [Ganoderma sinense ZZ0214-1]
MSNLNIGRLGPRAAGLARFMADRAREAQAPYVLIGASALIIRGVIRRETKDLDFNIAPRKSAELQNAIAPHLQTARNEAVLVDGKTTVDKDAQTSFRIYKQVGLAGDNMKVDVSENMCALTPSAYTNVDGVHVATVPLMLIFKMCAIARQNRSTWSEKALKDAMDLAASLRYLKAYNEVVPADVLRLLAHEQPRFLWSNFWATIGQVASNAGITVEEVEYLLHAVGVSKTRD